MGKTWHKVRFPLGAIAPHEVPSKLEHYTNLVKVLVKKRKHGSPWYRFDTPSIIKPHIKDLIILIPCLDEYTVEVYKDLGYDIETCRHISRATRRVHFTRIELWEDHA